MSEQIFDQVETLVGSLTEYIDNSRREPFSTFFGNSTTGLVHFGIAVVRVCGHASAQEEALLALVRQDETLLAAIRSQGTFSDVRRSLRKWSLIMPFMALGFHFGWWDLCLPAKPEEVENVFRVQDEIVRIVLKRPELFAL